MVSDDSCHQPSNRLSQLHPPGKREKSSKLPHDLVSFPGHLILKRKGNDPTTRLV